MEHNVSRIVIAFAAAAAIAASAYATSDTWQTREGVGTGGTNWATYEDPDNWAGGVAPSGYEGGDSVGLPASAVYINSTNGFITRLMTSAASSRSAYPVLRGDSTIGIRYDKNVSTTANTLLNRLYLYSDWSWSANDYYQGPGNVDFCGDCKSFSGNMLAFGTTRYRFDLYSNTPGETRSYSQILRPGGGDNVDMRMNGGTTLVLVAPRGSDDDIVGTWSQTAGSPFLSRVGDEHALCVGTTVTGDGIPDGTFLKRAFPDGTIELSAAATNTIAANSLTFAAFAPDFSANMYRIYPHNSVGIVTVRAQKHRAKDKARFTSYIQPSTAAFGAAGIKIGAESGFVPATLALSSNAGYVNNFTLENCELEFTGSGKNSNKDFYYCTFSVPNSAHTARLLAGAGKSPSIGIITNRVGKVVKGGPGRLSIGLPPNARAKCTGAIEVEEGTLEIRGASSGDNYIPSLTVRSGATLYAPDGIVCGNLVVEAGGVISGRGALSCAALTAAPGVIVDGVTFSCDTATDEQLAALTYRNGGGYAAKTPSGAAFGLELLSGDVSSFSDGEDTIFVIPTNSMFRVTGTASVDMLLVGGGGGGGSRSGGGGGGGGVVYTQNLAVAEGVWSVGVGAGGHGAASIDDLSSNGGDSCGFGVCAYGGGAGGTSGQYNGTTMGGKPLPGASGGGGGTWYPGTVGYTLGAAGIDGQGFGGGSSTNASSHWWCMGGGGGGAGALGTSAYVAEGPSLSGYTSRLYGGNGGDGIACDITGAAVYYGGGGGGGGTKFMVDGSAGVGGLGGGGSGGKTTTDNVLKKGGDGTPFTGGGGGGGSGYSSSGGNGGNGGCGVAIIRVRNSLFGKMFLEEPAIGGTVRRRGGYAVHTFTNSGTFSIDAPVMADILVVGGGGGGGRYSGGGGGGGGVLMYTNVYLFAGDYPVVVGDGGKGCAAYFQAASTFNGKDSSFGVVYSADFDKVAYGGGGGGSRTYPNGASTGASGGGAGAGYPYDGAQGYRGGVSTKGQGYSGGSSTNLSMKTSWLYNVGGGGGGAGAAGADGYVVYSSTVVAGKGGDGVMCDFSGTETWYGGGGGGGTSRSLNYPLGSLYDAKGGKGGGGRGAARNGALIQNGEDGKPNTGGGGGGGASIMNGNGDGVSDGGAGGSGIVIIRYHVRPMGTTIIVQ